MTWSEFRLRLFGYNREQERDEKKLRRLAWVTYIAPHQDPKRLRGLKEEKWWKIGPKQTESRVTDTHRQRFIREYQKYIDKKKKLGTWQS